MRKNRIRFSGLALLGGLICSAGFCSVACARDMESYPRVRLQSLDKVTARTMTFDARVGSTLKFGSLYIKVQSCQKTTPIEQPESATFLQIWEVGPEEESHWVFSGWMFASSPALSPLDHPIYDVWLLDCLPDETGETEETPAANQENSDAPVMEEHSKQETPPGE